MIIKMQKSIASYPPGEESLLLTNENNNIQCFTPVDNEALRLLRGRNLAYFNMIIQNNQMIIQNEVPNQPW